MGGPTKGRSRQCPPIVLSAIQEVKLYTQDLSLTSEVLSIPEQPASSSSYLPVKDPELPGLL